MKLIMEETGKSRRVIDYSTLTFREIQRRIKRYKQRFGSYEDFLEGFDCDYASIDDFTVLMDWENLLQEKEKRILEGRIRIYLNSRRGKVITELTNGNLREFYRQKVLPAERRGLVKYRQI